MSAEPANSRGPEPSFDLEGLEPLIEKLARRIVELERELRPPEAANGERSPWMSLPHAAAYLDWPRQRLYKLTAQGAIPHYKQEGACSSIARSSRAGFTASGRERGDEWLVSGSRATVAPKGNSSRRAAHARMTARATSAARARDVAGRAFAESKGK